MSKHINRFLLSTCLPLLALSISMLPNLANAGFDWTPPEDTQEVLMPDVPAPVVKGDALPPVDDRSKQDVKTPVFQQPIENSGNEHPKMQVKVLNHSKESEQKAINKDGNSAQKPPVAQVQKPDEIHTKSFTPKPVSLDSVTPMPGDKISDSQESKPVVLTNPAKPETSPASVDKKLPKVMENQEPKLIEDKGQKKTPVMADDPKVKNQVTKEKAVPKSQQEGELSINPFPLKENNPSDQNKVESAVVLPTDPEQTIGKITPAHSAVTKQENVESIQWNKNETFAVVEGFGKDTPLVMALGQIVPAKYAYSFGKGVNPGTVVSWDGGKPWNEVLQSILTPLHIGIKIEGQVLSLFTTDISPDDVSAPITINTSPSNEAVPLKAEVPIKKEKKSKKKQETTFEEIAPTPLPLADETKDEGKTTKVEPTPLLQPEESEVDKTKDLQAEQLKKIQSPSQLGEPPAEKPLDKETQTLESERYNLTAPNQMEQKKK